jgi:hypothetical protein
MGGTHGACVSSSPILAVDDLVLVGRFNPISKDLRIRRAQRHGGVAWDASRQESNRAPFVAFQSASTRCGFMRCLRRRLRQKGTAAASSNRVTWTSGGDMSASASYGYSRRMRPCSRAVSSRPRLLCRQNRRQLPRLMAGIVAGQCRGDNSAGRSIHLPMIKARMHAHDYPFCSHILKAPSRSPRSTILQLKSQSHTDYDGR